AFGNTATGYTGNHDITFSGATSSTAPVTAPTVGATPFGTPATLSFTGGVTTSHALVLYRVESAPVAASAGDGGPGGTTAITASATVLGTISGSTPAVAVAPAATTQLTLTSGAASPQTAGDAFDFTVTAKDAYDNITPAYAATVHVSSTDARATLPADYTFT